jgi:hypothetical protein
MYQSVGRPAAVSLLLASLLGVAGWGVATPPVRAFSSSVSLVTDLGQVVPRSEEQAQAWSDAMDFARDHGADVGYPWLDPDSGELIVTAVTAAGRELLSSSRSSATITVRDGRHSVAELDRVQNDITQLRSLGAPDADEIYMTSPDHRNGRVVVSVWRLTDRLAAYLDDRYGSDVVEVMVNPYHHPYGPASRQYDGSPFWGGAQIGTPTSMCSDAFSWTTGSQDAMLTAAHCISSGGSVNTPAMSMGTVTAGYEENWDDTFGTTLYYGGDMTYRGDVALIRLASGRSSVGVMYRGGPNSVTFSYVKSMWSRSPVVGDSFITGGRTTGLTWPMSGSLP